MHGEDLVAALRPSAVVIEALSGPPAPSARAARFLGEAETSRFWRTRRMSGWANRWPSESTT